MNFQQTRTRLKKLNLEVFTTQEFKNIFGFDEKSAAVKLTRYKNAGYLVSPKRGVYYLADEPVDKFKIANRLYFPSYVSLDSILSARGIIPEVVYTITSVTTKASREFSDAQTVYKYYKIKKGAFLGYQKEGEKLVATPEKALVDYLYFVSQGKRALNERLNLEKINRQQVFYYAKFFASKRLNNLLRRLFDVGAKQA